MNKIFVVVAGEIGVRLLSAARTMNENGLVWALCFSRQDPSPLFSAGADHVVFFSGAGDEKGMAIGLGQLAKQEDPDVILFPSTVVFRSVAPMLAARLETGLTADCTHLALRPDGLLLQTRPALGGNLTADILCENSRPQMATVQEDALPATAFAYKDTGTVSQFSCPQESVCKLLSAIPRGAAAGSIRNAKIIVSGGKGIATKEGFEKLRTLVQRIPGAALGASRGAVSASLAPYECQVGLTGEFVRPDIYVALGISGAVQHLTGMKQSGYIIAVNTDARAPIFDYSDLAVVAPWEETVDILLHDLSQ